MSIETPVVDMPEEPSPEDREWEARVWGHKIVVDNAGYAAACEALDAAERAEQERQADEDAAWTERQSTPSPIEERAAWRQYEQSRSINYWVELYMSYSAEEVAVGRHTANEKHLAHRIRQHQAKDRDAIYDQLKSEVRDVLLDPEVEVEDAVDQALAWELLGSFFKSSKLGESNKELIDDHLLNLGFNPKSQNMQIIKSRLLSEIIKDDSDPNTLDLDKIDDETLTKLENYYRERGLELVEKTVESLG